MKLPILITIVALAILAACTNGKTEFSETIHNPLIEQRADPHVMLHSDGYYYMTATVPAYDVIELRRARTIAGLATADIDTIWTRHESGPMSHHIWAPEIHFIDGAWYIHFAAGMAEDIWHIRMYVLANKSADPFEGVWVEKGQVVTDWDSFSLDAHTFEHRGARYLVWAQSEPPNPGTSLFIAEMDTPWSVISPQIKISEPGYDWERQGHNVNEGAAVLIRNGRIFMTYSASATDHNYRIGLLTADVDADLLDPESWEKSPVPVMGSSDETVQYGPGHNSFTTSPDGEIDYIVYHARNYKEIDGEPLRNPDRHTRVQQVHWNEDGTPYFGIPVASGPLVE
jgi:GH43 family beta-xylosidase